MKKQILLRFLILGVCLILIGCSENSDETSNGNNNKDAAETTEFNNKDDEEKFSDDDKQAQKEEAGKDLSLPEDIPEDFPLPEGIVITKIADKSDEDKVAYYMDISFDDINVDTVFDMYRDYSEKINYSVQTDGEVKSLTGVYQFSALKSSKDMFIITLRPKEENGMIQILIGK